MNIFKSMEQVRITLPLGTHTDVIFKAIEELPVKPPAQPACNIILEHNGLTYKDYRTQQSLGFAFSELEQQLSLKESDPEAWYGQAIGRQITVWVTEDLDATSGKTYINTRYRAPKPTDSASTSPQEPQRKQRPTANSGQ